MRVASLCRFSGKEQVYREREREREKLVLSLFVVGAVCCFVAGLFLISSQWCSLSLSAVIVRAAPRPIKSTWPDDSRYSLHPGCAEAASDFRTPLYYLGLLFRTLCLAESTCSRSFLRVYIDVHRTNADCLSLGANDCVKTSLYTRKTVPFVRNQLVFP